MVKRNESLNNAAAQNWQIIKKIFIFLCSLSLGIGLFGLVFRQVGWEEVKKSFFFFEGWQGLIVLALTFLVSVINTVKWQIILRGLGGGRPLSFKKTFSSYLSAFSIRYFIPIMVGAPELFQAQNINQKTDIPFKKSLASVIIDRVLEATIFIIFIVLSLLLFFLKIGIVLNHSFLFFFLFLLLSVSFLSFFYLKSFKGESFLKPLFKVFNSKINEKPYEIEQEILFFLKLKNKTFWQGVFLNLFRVAVVWLRAFLLVGFLGKGFLFFPSLIIFSFYFCVSIFPIPAGLGSQDAAHAFIFSLLGIGAGTGTAFVMIIRASELVFAIIGLLLFFHYGALFLKRRVLKNNN